MLTILKAKQAANLPKFEWKRFTKERKLGSGGFGKVYLGKYEGENEKVVVKKMKGENYDAKSRFTKEAKLLNATQGHRNIVSFFRIL